MKDMNPYTWIPGFADPLFVEAVALKMDDERADMRALNAERFLRGASFSANVVLHARRLSLKLVEHRRH